MGLIIAGFDVSFVCSLAALLHLFLVYFARLTIADVLVKKSIVDAVLKKYGRDGKLDRFSAK